MGATKDTHPDAHACRLKLSAALAHAPMDMPWNLSLEMAHYVQKFAAVSAACQLTREEELQILQITICDPDDPAHLATPVLSTMQVALLHNRQLVLRSADPQSLPLIELSKRHENADALLTLERPPHWDWTRMWHDNVLRPDADEQLNALLQNMTQHYNHQRELTCKGALHQSSISPASILPACAVQVEYEHDCPLRPAHVHAHPSLCRIPARAARAARPRDRTRHGHF